MGTFNFTDFINVTISILGQFPFAKPMLIFFLLLPSVRAVTHFIFDDLDGTRERVVFEAKKPTQEETPAPPITQKRVKIYKGAECPKCSAPRHETPCEYCGSNSR